MIRQLHAWLVGRTLIVVTHRPALLKLADRIVVMDNGRVVADGPRDQILAKAASNTPAPAAAVVADNKQGAA